MFDTVDKAKRISQRGYETQPLAGERLVFDLSVAEVLGWQCSRILKRRPCRLVSGRMLFPAAVRLVAVSRSLQFGKSLGGAIS